MKHILGERYFNCHPYAVIIVAVEGAIGDWAAYIGVISSAKEPTQQHLEHIARNGCKLAKHEACAFFPALNPKGYRP